MPCQVPDFVLIVEILRCLAVYLSVFGVLRLLVFVPISFFGTLYYLQTAFGNPGTFPLPGEVDLTNPEILHPIEELLGETRCDPFQSEKLKDGKYFVGNPGAKAYGELYKNARSEYEQVVKDFWNTPESEGGMPTEIKAKLGQYYLES